MAFRCTLATSMMMPVYAQNVTVSSIPAGTLYMDTICLGDLCLSAAEDHENLYNGVAVTLQTWQGFPDDPPAGPGPLSPTRFEFYLTSSEDTWSSGFEIHVGRAQVGHAQAFVMSNWCLDGGATSEDGAALFIWECNGLPQQQFVLDYDYTSQSMYCPDCNDMYMGQLRFASGQCLDGTNPIVDGNNPIVWDCNQSPQQYWGACPYRNTMGWQGPCSGMGLVTV